MRIQTEYFSNIWHYKIFTDLHFMVLMYDYGVQKSPPLDTTTISNQSTPIPYSSNMYILILGSHLVLGLPG